MQMQKSEESGGQTDLGLIILAKRLVGEVNELLWDTANDQHRGESSSNANMAFIRGTISDLPQTYHACRPRNRISHSIFFQQSLAGFRPCSA